MNRRILKLTLPNIITNITVPLLGMVDLAIVGHIGNVTYIGAIAIGTTIFNFVYWNFSFLRMGTSGFTAQAYGARDLKQTINTLVKAVIIAIFIATFLIIFQKPIAKLAFYLFETTSEMKSLTYQYFKIRIWAAPATLLLFTFNGWFIGMQNANIPMIIAIVSNILNIIFSLLFAIVLQMGIAGVAWGTLLSQWTGLLMFIVFWYKYYRKLWNKIKIKDCLKWQEMKGFFQVNIDIFLRSFCLLIVFSFFPVAGSKEGDMILAINAILMHFFSIFSYIMDGFGFAGEALTGKYIGAKDEKSLKKMIRLIFCWGIALSLFFTILYAFCGDIIMSILTDKKEVILAAHDYYFWVLTIPLAGFSAFLWDGIFIGATASKAMRNTMFVATSIFFLTYYVLKNIYTNNALWLALILFLITRGILQWLLSKKSVYQQAKK